MTRQEEIDRIKDYIVQEIKPEQIILFGSSARGDFNANSDVDLLIVVPSAESFKGSRIDTLNFLYKNSPQNVFNRDFVLRTHDEFEYWKDSPNNLVGRAVAEGKILYEG